MPVNVTMRTRRKQLGLTQEKLAEKSGVAHSTLVRVEHGGGCRTGTLLRIAAALEVEPGQLIAGQ